MNTKTWSADYKDIRIEVSNSWNWYGDTEEKVIINGEIVLQRAYNIVNGDVSFTRAIGTIFHVSYGEYNVRVVCGHAWHCLGMACRIEVNGEYAGGNRVVLFAKDSTNETKEGSE